MPSTPSAPSARGPCITCKPSAAPQEEVGTLHEPIDGRRARGIPAFVALIPSQHPVCCRVLLIACVRLGPRGVPPHASSSCGSPVLLAYGFAVLAAATNAVSNVLQRKADRDQPPELAMSPRLVVELVQRPVWLLGFVAVIASFALMMVALSMGSLAAVQPVLVLELPLTLVAGQVAFGNRVSRQDWAGTAIVTAGLAGLVAFLSPGAGGKGHASGTLWLLAGVATVGIVVVCVLAGLRTANEHRAALFGAGAGVMFGLTSALMKGVTASFGHGVGGVVTAWQTYALVLAGAAAMFLMQNALQAGRLVAAQPGMTLGDPTIAILWGIFVFHEGVSGGLFVVLGALSGVVMAAGAVMLARSPAL